MIDKKKELHLICNAHLDPVWQWGWEEGAAAAVATFRSAADLSDRYDFIFCHNEALLYEWIEEYEPELFERIKEFVRAGKWHIMGGWYLQPDCNLPSGESLIRQALVGRAYFAEKFGEEFLPETAVNFDPFGHSLGLPQILKKCGYRNYLFMRPLPQDEQGIPGGAFLWRGVDGSEVKASYSGFYASALGKLHEKVECECAALERGEDPRIQNDGTLLLSCWGVGNHGGGPSARDLEYLEQYSKEESAVTIVHSTPDRFFQRITPDTVYDKSLNNSMPGCYTSVIRIKQMHRELENRLYSVEKMSSAAALNGLLTYPEEELREAEKDLLFCEFHDILPGSCIRLGEETALKRMSHGIDILDRLRLRAFFALCSGLPKANEGEYPILVYNYHPYAVKTSISCGLMLADQQWDERIWTGFDIFDGEKKLPSQMVREASNINLDWSKRVMFDCELPAFSMRMFRARQKQMTKPSVRPLPDNFVYTDSYKTVVFNSKTGFIDGITVGGKSYVKRGTFAPYVYEDNADAWGMGKEQRARLGKRLRAFRLMNARETAAFLNAPEEVPPLRVVEDGKICCVVEGFYKYADSSIVMRYMLYRNAPEVDLELRVLWNESDKLLKLHVNADFKGEYTGQVAYGREAFPQTGRENVAQQWVAYGNQDKMLAMINDGIYGSSCDHGQVGITLLRGAVYAAHPIEGRPLIPRDRFSDRIDQGERFYRFRFVAGRTDALSPVLDRKAQIFNESPFVLNCYPSGKGEPVRPLIQLSDEAVRLTALKRARSGEGYVIRLSNNTDAPRSTVLTVSAPGLPQEGAELALNFEKYEFKTIRFADGELTECFEAQI